MWKAEVSTVDEWQEIAKKVAKELDRGILLLKGNLGAGKTTFTQALVKELGSGDKVTSPTFSIVNEYHSPKGNIYHFDLYRLKKIEEVYDIGIDDYLADAYLSIIEWPELFEDELYEPYHQMEIENMGMRRKIIFK